MMKENASKVLVVDDDEDIVEMLKYNLKKQGYQVKTASNGKEAITIATKFRPNLILMDIMMPQMDGVEAGRILREKAETQDVFILYLTARNEEYSEIAAYETGADDYLIKPVKPRALMSKIQAIFRREKKKEIEAQEIKVGDLRIFKESYTIHHNNQEINLPKKEFELLHFLALHPDKVFSRDDLLHNIWGSDVYVLARTVDVHVRKIREKIGGKYIKTIKGVGYKFTLKD